MAEVIKDGGWYEVLVNGELLGQFPCGLDANRYALSLLHDGAVSQVKLSSGVQVEP